MVTKATVRERVWPATLFIAAVTFTLTGCDQPEIADNAAVLTAEVQECSEATVQRIMREYVAEVGEQLVRAGSTLENQCRSYARGLSGAWLGGEIAFSRQDRFQCETSPSADNSDPDRALIEQLTAFRPQAARVCGPQFEAMITQARIEARGRARLRSLPIGERKQVEEAWQAGARN